MRKLLPKAVNKPLCIDCLTDVDEGGNVIVGKVARLSIQGLQPRRLPDGKELKRR